MPDYTTGLRPRRYGLTPSAFNSAFALVASMKPLGQSATARTGNDPENKITHDLSSSPARVSVANLSAQLVSENAQMVHSSGACTIG
ncbi:hypothetical protein SAMN05444170_6137 [Bradyrhizobium erythrophlei]|uniref:Uncharacterized protein n=1 Tax=Bradyrhizobium erythrophlei TaxID=1437360 RepID=A0A1M7UPV7_9BRAD|nr:hypothetical protein SAMN05444170_6137 [Bradyrhizobium erythrophlei]